MAEVVDGVLGGNSGKCFGDRLLKGGNRAGLELSQLLFDLGPAFFDRVEVRRVGRQVTECCAGLFNEFPYAVHFVRSEIVHDDQLTGLQLWTKNVFQISPEDIAIGGCFDGHRCYPAGNGDRSQHRQGSPAAGRNSFLDARAAQRPSITPRHFRRDAALVDEDELRRIDLPGFLLPELALCFDPVTVPLGGVE